MLLLDSMANAHFIHARTKTSTRISIYRCTAYYMEYTFGNMHIWQQHFTRNPFSFHFHGKLLYLLIILYVNHATLLCYWAAAVSVIIISITVVIVNVPMFVILRIHNDKNCCETFRINQKESTYFTVENFVAAVHAHTHTLSACWNLGNLK